MNREDIIRMAREAGFGIGPMTQSIYANTPCNDQIEHFAAIVAAAERDRIAAFVEDAFDFCGEEILVADAIRARVQK